MKDLNINGGFGLEKESLRVNEQGRLSDTPHPFLKDKHIDRDFCENQIEIITDVFDNIDDMYNQLVLLNRKVKSEISNLKSGREYLWPFSNPPYVKDNDIRIASFQGEQKGKQLYREYLAKKYGKKKMLFSGIHYNFSFSEQYIKAQYEKQYGDKNAYSFTEYKNHTYLELAKKLTQYSWMIVYLMSASPVCDTSFNNFLGRSEISGSNRNDLLKNSNSTYTNASLPEYASIRCGRNGYWNEFVPILEFDTIEKYADSISGYIESGQLMTAGELYYPVRLKPKGENSLENLKKSGVNHIELRMLDLNPLSENGIKKEDLYFIYYFIMYLQSLKTQSFGVLEQNRAISNMKEAAKFDDTSIAIEESWNTKRNIRQLASEVLKDMEKYFKNNEYAKTNIRYQMEKIINPENRYAYIVYENYSDEYVKKGIELSKEYAHIRQ